MAVAAGARGTLAMQRLGVIRWPAALEVQRKTLERVQTGANQHTLLLCEHPPVYTMGRSMEANPVEAKRLEAYGAEVHQAQRGGNVTFHGPGQLVGYPIINLKEIGLRPRYYVAALEQAMIKTCADFGISATTTEDTGVWVGNNKIAAIGVQITRGVCWHGFAINCNTDLAWFGNIVPCGLIGKGVTSLSKECGQDVYIGDVLEAAAGNLAKELQLTLQPDFADGEAPWPFAVDGITSAGASAGGPSRSR